MAAPLNRFIGTVETLPDVVQCLDSFSKNIRIENGHVYLKIKGTELNNFEDLHNYVFNILKKTELTSKNKLSLLNSLKVITRELTSIDRNLLNTNVSGTADTASIERELSQMVASERLISELELTLQTEHLYEQRLEEAKALAVTNPKELCLRIATFDLREKDRVEMAKLIAPKKATLIAKYIKNFGITNESDRIEIARLAISKKALAVAKYIKKFGITNESARVEIAKHISRHIDSSDAFLFIHAIEKFKIADEEGRLEIAKLLADIDPLTVALHIEKFNIKNEIAMAELVKRIAQRNGLVVAQQIEKFHFSEEHRIEIARLIAQTNAPIVSLHIKKFNIPDERVRIEIAKLAAQQNGSNVISDLAQLNITDENERLAILKLAIKQDPSCMDKLIRLNTLSTERWTLMSLIASWHREKNVSATYDALKIYLKDLGFKDVFKEIATFTSPEDDQKMEAAIHWLIHIAFCLLETPSPPNDPSLWLKLFKYPDSSMRYPLTNCALAIFADREKTRAYYDFLSSSQGPIEYLKLPGLLFFEKNTRSFIDLKGSMIQAREFLKEASILKGFIDAQHAILKAPISEKEADFLIRQILILPSDAKRIQYLKKQIAGLENAPIEIQRMKQKLKKVERAAKLGMRNRQFLIQSIIAFNQLPRLLQAMKGHLESVKTTESPMKSYRPFDVNHIYKTIFTEIIPVKEIENFSHRFMETFGTSSLPSAVLTYANSLQALESDDKEKAMELLHAFVQSVLDGTFIEKRYREEESEHLQLVFTAQRDLKDQWMLKQVSTTDIDPEYVGYTCENSDHFDDLLLCGTTIGSCQSVDFNAEYSKCLLAYLLDGKIRLLAIKDSHGNMVARSILRLLWDERAGRPVLMQERIYTQVGLNPKLKQSLDRFAIQEARRLGLSLFKDSEQDAIKVKLESKGGISPWEYVDSANGVQENSQYRITHAQRVYDPIR